MQWHAANYQASKAKNEFIEMKRKQEEWEIDNLEEQEKEEIRDIYREKGFKDELLEDVVRTITSKTKGLGRHYDERRIGIN